MYIAFIAAPLLLFGQSSEPAKPDPKAEAAMSKLSQRLRAAKTASGTIEVRMLGTTETYQFQFMRPNLARFSSAETLFLQDGKKLYWYLKPENEYTEYDAPKAGLPKGTAFNLGGLTGLEALAFPDEPELVPTKLATERRDGQSATVVHLQSPSDKNLTVKLFLDSKSGLPTGWAYELGEYVSSGTFKGLKLDVPLKASQFVWSKPAGAKLYKADGS